MFNIISLTFFTFQITTNETQSFIMKFCSNRTIYVHKRAYSTKIVLHVNTLQNL